MSDTKHKVIVVTQPQFWENLTSCYDYGNYWHIYIYLKKGEKFVDRLINVNFNQVNFAPYSEMIKYEINEKVIKKLHEFNLRFANEILSTYRCGVIYNKITSKGTQTLSAVREKKKRMSTYKKILYFHNHHTALKNCQIYSVSKFFSQFIQTTPFSLCFSPALLNFLANNFRTIQYP